MANKVDVDMLSDGEILRVLMQPRGPLRRYLEVAAAEWRKNANQLSRTRLHKGGHRTGVYDQSFRADLITTGRVRLEVGNIAPYASFLEEGVKPKGKHPAPNPRIARAVRAGALRYMIGGVTIIVTRNTRPHPGISPREIVKDALKRALTESARRVN